MKVKREKEMKGDENTETRKPRRNNLMGGSNPKRPQDSLGNTEMVPPPGDKIEMNDPLPEMNFDGNDINFNDDSEMGFDQSPVKNDPITEINYDEIQKNIEKEVLKKNR